MWGGQRGKKVVQAGITIWFLAITLTGQEGSTEVLS